MILPEIGPFLFEPRPRDEPHRVQASFLRTWPLFSAPFDGFFLSLDRETHARDQEKEEEEEYGAAKTLPTEASAKSRSLSSRDRSLAEARDFQKK